MKREEMERLLIELIRNESKQVVACNIQDQWREADIHKGKRSGLVLAMTTLKEAWSKEDGV